MCTIQMKIECLLAVDIERVETEEIEETIEESLNWITSRISSRIEDYQFKK